LYKSGVNAIKQWKTTPDKLVGVWYKTSVYAKDIDLYLDDFFYSALHAWYITKTWEKFAFIGGWAENPMDYIDSITALESVYNEFEQEQMEKQRKESENKRKYKK
jgi:hypothetical protein